MAEHATDKATKSLQQALASWPQWSASLVEKPRLINALNNGLSHSTYLISSGTEHFALRVESPESRALAMSKTQEIALMGSAGSLAPEIVWSDHRTLVTRFVHGATWQPLEKLEALCQSLHQLHRTHSEVAGFDLLLHCDQYWQNIRELFTVNEHTSELFEQCRAHLQQTLQQYPEQCLCHNDLNPDNILQQEDRFVFLDWEYACNNSPYFELATIVEFYALSDLQTRQFSSCYWQSINTEQHLTALQAFRVVVRFTEWLWLTLKESELTGLCESKLQTLLEQQGKS